MTPGNNNQNIDPTMPNFSLFFILYSSFFILHSSFFILHSSFFILHSLFFILLHHYKADFETEWVMVVVGSGDGAWWGFVVVGIGIEK